MKFQDLRKDIFKEIVRLNYNHNLKKGIDSLPDKFLATDDKEKITAIKNEILLAMGLNPKAKYDTELAREVDAAYNLKQVEKPIVTVNQQICQDCQEKECVEGCQINDEEGLLIEDGRCISCGECIPKCPLEAISDKIEFIPVAKHLQEDAPVYAHVAPAIVGQFGQNIKPGQIRMALKSIGFTDMVEVALFADILSLREADEFNHMVQTEDDFLITSCCCPVWINLLNKHYPDLSERLTKTVSPMIASGRVIKNIFPGAITVFIGPCIAKKAEAKAPELRGAIDYVLTFDELAQVFKALDIDLASFANDHKEQSSYGGRIYAHTGGVSEAVKITVERIAPGREIPFKAHQADGVKDCINLLNRFKKGQVKANFIEGMGCEGGCVGGPKRNIDVDLGTKHVVEYARRSRAKNPVDNMNISHILKYLNRIGEKNIKVLDQLSFDKILLRD